MARARPGFSIGWVVVSYFMVAGGVVMGMSALGALDLASPVAVHALLFVGAAVGGLFAGRASHGKSVIEPAVAGALLVISCIGLLLLVPGMRVLVAIDGEQLARILGVGAMTGVGGLVGATLGARSAPPRRSTDWYRWAGISALISLGIMFLVIVALAILVLRSRDGAGLGDDAGAGIGLAGMGAGALFGPLVAQVIAPIRMNRACAGGVVLLMLAMALLTLGSGDREAGRLITGFAVLAVAGYLIGLIGARVGWAVHGKEIEAAVEAESVARAFE